MIVHFLHNHIPTGDHKGRNVSYIYHPQITPKPSGTCHLPTITDTPHLQFIAKSLGIDTLYSEKKKAVFFDGALSVNICTIN